MQRKSDSLDVKVDWSLCIGCQVCVNMADKTFKMVKSPGGEDKADVIEGFSDDVATIEDARTSCPVAAIIVAKQIETKENKDATPDQ